MIKIITLIFILSCLFNSGFAGVLIMDNFEYVAERTGTGADALITTGGWTAAKANNMTGTPNACGYLSTVTSIPGFAGTFPGKNSNRVLLSEHLPLTNNCDQGAGPCPGGRLLQSDTYFGYGANGSRALPAHIWIQFWMYPQYYGDQLSTFYSGKFLYSCGDDTYFSTCQTAHLDWMGTFKSYQSYAPYCDSATSNGSFYFATQTQGNAEYDGTSGPCGEVVTELGHTATNPKLFSPNTWHLVKIEYDISDTTPVYRLWRRTQNETEFTLAHEWVDGTTAGLTWTPYTTLGYYWLTILEMNACYDMWMYFDDFSITDSESDLETYNSNSATAAGVTFSGASFY